MRDKSPCPKCASDSVFHTYRSFGEKWRIEGKILGGVLTRPESGKEVAKTNFMDHQCRACQHRWGTKTEDRNEKWRVGHKTPVESFSIPVLLPHHVCHCGADYGLLARKRGYVAMFCPYCGEATRIQPAGDWLAELREQPEETEESGE